MSKFSRPKNKADREQMLLLALYLLCIRRATVFVALLRHGVTPARKIVAVRRRWYRDKVQSQCCTLKHIIL